MTAGSRCRLVLTLLAPSIALLGATVTCDPPECWDGSTGTLYLLDIEDDETADANIYRVELEVDTGVNREHRAYLTYLTTVPDELGGGGHIAVTPEDDRIYVIQAFCSDSMAVDNCHELSFYDIEDDSWTNLGAVGSLPPLSRNTITQATIDENNTGDKLIFYFGQRETGVFMIDLDTPNVAAPVVEHMETQSGDLAFGIYSNFYQMNRRALGSDQDSALYQIQLSPTPLVMLLSGGFPKLVTGLAAYGFRNDQGDLIQRLMASFPNKLLAIDPTGFDNPHEFAWVHPTNPDFKNFEGDLATPTCR